MSKSDHFAFLVFFLIEWIGYIGYKGGFIVGTVIIGILLYGGALVLEKYGSMIVLALY